MLFLLLFLLAPGQAVGAEGDVYWSQPSCFNSRYLCFSPEADSIGGGAEVLTCCTAAAQLLCFQLILWRDKLLFSKHGTISLPTQQYTN